MRTSLGGPPAWRTTILRQIEEIGVAEFWQALTSQAFMQRAVVAGLLACVSCSMIGTYVVVKRITFVSGGIAHAVLGGMGVAYFLEYNPMVGALAAAIVAALLIGVISLRAGQHEDTIIGALWAIGMAIGVIFMYMTPGYRQDLMSYLFGNILLVSPVDLWLVAGLDAAILLIVLLFYKRFQALCFDEEFTRVQGVNVDAFYLLLLCLIALTVVILVQLVGIILVIALLTLPAATGSPYARSLKQMMFIALGAGCVAVLGGLVVSYRYDMPSGATIVLIAGAIYLAAIFLHRIVIRALFGRNGAVSQ